VESNSYSRSPRLGTRMPTPCAGTRPPLDGRHRRGDRLVREDAVNPELTCRDRPAATGAIVPVGFDARRGRRGHGGRAGPVPSTRGRATRSSRRPEAWMRSKAILGRARPDVRRGDPERRDTS